MSYDKGQNIACLASPKDVPKIQIVTLWDPSRDSVYPSIEQAKQPLNVTTCRDERSGRTGSAPIKVRVMALSISYGLCLALSLSTQGHMPMIRILATTTKVPHPTNKYDTKGEPTQR